ncbi:hypothetical protein SARC_09583 [Sphaeroforma arctica JP610]|uniref:Uncharacterized protein n=1 Tax=Sphaeroforma arctica JP610 TaxID=667725 RepID=A0A0L0FMI5_9EUKA|nr:hypothetical protein SARC_09583 [Sphaeroforma arctica JP610]KNC77972.1 hypothetical protein SARC_09583 [Sphaeroforma arctica JP610]|eukprot:XP_014151874.1 hypothetical protein SARC_09583 [Sphaeroforma arctica JP610]
MRSRPRTTIGSNPHSNSKRTRSTSNTTDAAANSTSNDSKTNDGNDSDHTAARTGDRGDDSNHVTDEDIMALLSTHHATSSATLGMQKMSKVEASQLDARALSGWRLLIGHPAAVDVNDANSLTITPAIFETLRTQRREQLHSSGSGRRAQARSAEGSTNESLTHVGAVRGPTDTTANVLKRVRLF